jgi:hypothetical protein
MSPVLTYKITRAHSRREKAAKQLSEKILQGGKRNESTEVQRVGWLMGVPKRQIEELRLPQRAGRKYTYLAGDN